MSKRVAVALFAVAAGLIASPRAFAGEKGTRFVLCEAPEGPFRQNEPGPFFLAILADQPQQRRETLEFDPDTGKWVEQKPPVPGTPAGDLALARADFAKNNYSRALRKTKAWIKTYGEQDELYPEAALLECRTMIARRDYYKAHLKLVDFLSEFAGTQFVDRALQMEFVIAETFLGGTKRKFLGLRILKADDVAINILDDIAANYPQTTFAELATLTKARYYWGQGDFLLAEQEYAFLVEQFPRSRYTRRALLQSARAAMAAFPGIPYDDAPLIEAEERFKQYVSLYPGSAEQEGIALLLDEISETRAAKELHIGDYYVRAGHPKAGRFYFRSTVEHWPRSIAAIKAAERLEAMGETSGRESEVPANTPAERPDEEVRE